MFEPLEGAVAELVGEGAEMTLTIETRAATPSGDPVYETAGGWRGLIDAETFEEAIYRDRLIATRPPAKM